MDRSLEIAAPYFEDFERGMEYEAPAMTLTEGIGALRQAITGDRLRLALDHHLCREITGRSTPIAHPLLVTDVAIGQSTWASQRAKANLFYRGLVLRRPVHLGETLLTSTRIVALRQNRSHAGRSATGMVALEIRTCNQDGDEVLRFWRCAMIPCRTSDCQTGHQDALDGIGIDPLDRQLRAAVPTHWRWEPTRRWRGLRAADLAAGTRLIIEARNTVTAAPELARLTLNLAMMHTDERLSYLGQRLVYGGHTIGVAFAQVSRVLPNLITVLGWERVEHTGPVLEGDRLRSECAIEEMLPCEPGAMLKLNVRTYADRGEPEGEKPVLEWCFWALSA